MDTEKVILVDINDKEIGTIDKLEAHRNGWLHRAFSVFIFNEDSKLLLQRRALTKYHSPGLWSNTCCSHPAPGEDTKEAAKRRLKEEMGFTCEMEHRFHFLYGTEFDNGLKEHELDHVFTGIRNKDPKPNPEEVMDFKWMTLPELQTDLKLNPEKYTFWLDMIIEDYYINIKL